MKVPDFVCHVRDTDGVPMVGLIKDPNGFGGELLFFCDQKHLLSYIKNPSMMIVEPSSTTQYYKTLENNYPLFFEHSEDVVLDQFTDVINLRQLEYWSGTSFAIRRFGENLIYSNYGVEAWFKGNKLGNKSDKQKIEELHDNIRKLGFSWFINLIISKTIKSDLINKNDAYIKRRYKLEGNRLNIARAASMNLRDIEGSSLWIGEDILAELNEVFGKLSPYVHPGDIASNQEIVKEIDYGISKVLDAYEQFYKNKNKWGVVYE